MDTSETYIKMHLALPKKLQEYPQEGDYYYDKETSEAGVCRLGEVYFPTDKMIKLYEQDQLQEMVGDRPNHPWDLAYAFGFFCNPMYRYEMYGTWVEEENGDGGIATRRKLLNQDEVDYPKQFTSMEQLWLAFVMKGKHNKVWNGREWAV